MSGAVKRKRRAGVEDRWNKTIRDFEGNEQRVPSAVHGKAAAGVPGMSTTRATNTPRDSRARSTLRPGWTSKSATR
jgi:hypothetical protein